MSLSVSDLSVQYGQNVVLESLDLEVASGERFAVMGPSGSGKSSLIRAIAGVVPGTGSIAIDGDEVGHLPPHQRPVGLMFQDYALFPHMDVATNVAYGLRMAGIGRRERDEQVHQLLEQVGLVGFDTRNVGSLSGGEQQRVALARTLAPKPALVMLDEPLGSLDLELRESLLAHMRSVLSEVGTTTIYVTHDRSEAFAFADRVAVLIHGRIAAVDTPAGLWRNPTTASVARLIGHPTVIDGTGLGFDGWVALPPDAVRIAPDGPLTGNVVDSVFVDGAFLTTITLGDTLVRSRTTTTVRPNTTVQVSIAGDLAIPLLAG
jgi:thiamine transport system ATP-binding protein